MKNVMLAILVAISPVVLAEQPQTKVHGFKMIQVQPDSIYSRMGFKSGDVLQSINGKPLRSSKDVNQAMNIINLEKKRSTVKVGVSRGGKPIILTYTFK